MTILRKKDSGEKFLITKEQGEYVSLKNLDDAKHETTTCAKFYIDFLFDRLSETEEGLEKVKKL